jgi:hypothetical protein
VLNTAAHVGVVREEPRRSVGARPRQGSALRLSLKDFCERTTSRAIIVAPSASPARSSVPRWPPAGGATSATASQLRGNPEQLQPSVPHTSSALVFAAQMANDGVAGSAGALFFTPQRGRHDCHVKGWLPSTLGASFLFGAGLGVRAFLAWFRSLGGAQPQPSYPLREPAQRASAST